MFLLSGFPSICFLLTGIVSLVSLAALSYDRYSTLTVYNKRGPDYRRPLLAVSGSWLYSLFWTVPPLLGWSSYALEGAGTSCSVSWTANTVGSHSYIICLFIFCLGVPVIVMVYCYGRLVYAVKQVGSLLFSLFSGGLHWLPPVHWMDVPLKSVWVIMQLEEGWKSMAESQAC